MLNYALTSIETLNKLINYSHEIKYYLLANFNGDACSYNWHHRRVRFEKWLDKGIKTCEFLIRAHNSKRLLPFPFNKFNIFPNRIISFEDITTGTELYTFLKDKISSPNPEFVLDLLEILYIILEKRQMDKRQE